MKMEDWNDRFLQFLGDYLRGTRPELDVVTVTSVFQDAGDAFSGCETCGWGSDDPQVDISYVDGAGDSCSVSIDGNLANIFGY